MNSKYDITITNGTGTANVLNGQYAVTATVEGYTSNIEPQTVNITSDKDTYDFTITADGTLTLHVTETGEQTGTPIVGAKFYRADSTGATYGEELTTDNNGNVAIPNVPYSTNSAPTVYFIQTASDGNHNFDNTVQSTTLNEQTKTLEIQNPTITAKTFTLTDANYTDLKIASGTISLN